MAPGFFERIGAIIGRRQSTATTTRQAERRTVERRHVARFNVLPDDGSASGVYLTLGTSPTPCLIRDLSVGGLCFEAKLPKPETLVNTEVAVTVHLNEMKYPLTIRVTNVREVIRFGCKIEKAPGTWMRDVSRYLDPIKIGQNLYPIDPSFVKQNDPDRTMLWYRSPPTCDITVWLDKDQRPESIQIQLIGDILEWSRQYGLRCAQVEEGTAIGGSRGYDKLDIFRWKTEVSEEFLHHVRRILAAAPRLPAEYRAVFGPR